MQFTLCGFMTHVLCKHTQEHGKTRKSDTVITSINGHLLSDQRNFSPQLWDLHPSFAMDPPFPTLLSFHSPFHHSYMWKFIKRLQ